MTDHQRQVVNTAEDAHNMGWRVLSLYAALTAHNQMVWICFSPIKDKAGIFFDLAFVMALRNLGFESGSAPSNLLAIVISFIISVFKCTQF